MKRWLALLLAAMMAFALVACGDTPANNGDNKKDDTKTEEFARGSWEGNVYTNDSLGLTITVPENWTVASDEELAEITGVVIENTANEDLSAEFLKAQNMYEMMAQDNEAGTNIIVMAENLAVSVGGTSYDEKAYSDVVINNLPEENGYTFAEGETLTIGGRDYYHVQASAYNGALGQDYLFTRVGKYMVCIIMSDSPAVMEASDMLGMLSGK